jgi:uncharacterized membrane protein YidH (DUF202 family)
MKNRGRTLLRWGLGFVVAGFVTAALCGAASGIYFSLSAHPDPYSTWTTAAMVVAMVLANIGVLLLIMAALRFLFSFFAKS